MLERQMDFESEGKWLDCKEQATMAISDKGLQTTVSDDELDVLHELHGETLTAIKKAVDNQ